MNQYINNILGKYTKIVAWGIGNFYTEYKELLDERLAYFVDNNEKKWGTSLDGKQIFSPEKLREENTKETLVIICNHFFEEISIQIKQYGDFDLLDIVTFDLVRQKEKELSAAGWPDGSRSIAVCGGIHAMWQTNGSRKFIDGQLDQLHRGGFSTIELVPLLYYQSGKRESPFLAVSINSAYQGLFPAGELAEVCPKVRGVIIHSLYYSHNTMRTLLDSIRVERKILYYIHDYACLCSHRFLHKDKELCIGANGAMLCDTCGWDEKRRKLLEFHYKVFKKHNVTMIAPSADTRIRVEPFYTGIEIAELSHLEYQRESFTRKVSDPVRIAYIGTAIWQKGWEQFGGLVDRFHEKYDFYCLGDCPDALRIPNVKYIPVGLKGSRIPEMTETLGQYGIDIAYIGSVWPETYSYTYYEAYEAGCFIITNTKSGNVSRQVTENQNGISFSSDSEMAEWLEKDIIDQDILKAGRRITNVRNSGRFLKYFQ